MPYKVEGVPKEAVGMFWPVIGPMLQPALDRSGDTVTLDDVWCYLENGRCMLWIVTEDHGLVAALVMHLPEDRNSLMVWLMGGRDFDGWRADVQPLLQRYAAEQGRAFVEAHVRPGLGRLLRRQGWRVRTELIALEAQDDEQG